MLHAVPCGKTKEVALLFKAVHAQEDKEAARRKSLEVISKLQAQRLDKADKIAKFGCDETLSYYDFPVAHWRHIRTNNPLERLNREIRRRTRVVGSFPDGHATVYEHETRAIGLKSESSRLDTKPCFTDWLLQNVRKILDTTQFILIAYEKALPNTAN